MASFKSARERANENHEERKRRFGGGVSDEKQDRKEVAAGVHKHERNMHKGEKETKLATGGKVEGRAAGGSRLDRKGGGKAGKKGTTVNIILGGAGQQQPPQVRPVPVPVRAPMPGAGGPPPGMPPGAMPPRPPVAGMGPGGPPGMPPPGAMPPGGPMMPPRKRGGSVKMTAGAGSGEGRIQKERMVE